jgi:hypothetical protein
VVHVADESVYVGAYWGPRAESVEACAGRLRTFLTRLSGLHPGLAQWHPTVDSPSSADPPALRLDDDALREYLSRGRARDDEDGQVMEDLGFDISLWNGREDDWAIGVMVTCGVTADVVPNSVVFDPPFPTPADLEMFRPPVVRGIVEAVVEAWAPQRAKFITNGLDIKQEKLPTPQVGWLTFIAGETPAAPPPAGAVVRPFGDGYTVQIGDEPLLVDASVVQQVRDWLGIGIPLMAE